MGGMPSISKYVIYAHIEVEGIVDKPDVIGAIFGQTEGLLGPELDLRELQKTGRIGRIQVELETRGGRSIGRIVIPSSLDRVETALIAAAIETVDKVGPYNARVQVERIEDVRSKKRKWIVERAKELLLKWEREEAPDLRELIEEVMRGVKAAEVVKYGPEGLPAGPDVDKSSTVIIVEGRADVINLVRHGYRNVIALGGATGITKIPKTIIELCKEKTAIAFVDGDRGGELILRELLQVADIDFIARAPPGREVEELTAKEIAKCLKNKISVEEYLAGVERGRARAIAKVVAYPPKEIADYVKSLMGTLEALILDENWKVMEKVPVKDLVDKLQSIDRAHAIVFDGIVTQRLVDIASSKGVKFIVGVRVGTLSRHPEGLKIFTFKEVLSEASEK